MKTIITLLIFLMTTLNVCSQIKEEEKTILDNKTYSFIGDLRVRRIDCELFINDIPVKRLGKGGTSSGKYSKYLKAGTNIISVILQTSIANTATNKPKSISFVFNKIEYGQLTSEGKQLASIKWEANGDEQYPVVLKNTFELSEKDFPLSFAWHKAEVITKKDIKKAKKLTITIHKHLKSGTLEEISSVLKPSFINEIAYPNNKYFKNEEVSFYKKVKEFAINKNSNYKILPLDEENIDVRVLGNKFIEVFFKNKDKQPIMSVIDTEIGAVWSKRMLFVKLNNELVLGQ